MNEPSDHAIVVLMRVLVLWLAMSSIALASAPAESSVVGAWELIDIVYSGPQGPVPDPFYERDSTGLLIYDASGTVSVQIAGPHRQGPAVPAERTVPNEPAARSMAKERAFDTYYAYFGRWKYDPDHATMTHRVQTSLLPAEDGAVYVQSIEIEGDRLILTTHERRGGAEMTRRKTWRRVTASGATGAAATAPNARWEKRPP